MEHPNRSLKINPWMLKKKQMHYFKIVGSEVEFGKNKITNKWMFLK